MTGDFTEHRDLLARAAAGQLPDHVDRTTGISMAVLQELVEAGYINAIDANSMDGPCYLEPRITIQGREYLRTLHQRATPRVGTINWVRAFNRLFEMINTSGPTYFSGPRFIKKVREVDPYFPNYQQVLDQRQKEGKSTSRSEYFYDILLSFSEEQRLELIGAVLADLREHMPDKVRALESEFGAPTPTLISPAVAPAPPVVALPSIKAPETVTPVVVVAPTADPPPSQMREFWRAHWQWIIGTAIAAASVVAAFIKG